MENEVRVGLIVGSCEECGRQLKIMVMFRDELTLLCDGCAKQSTVLLVCKVCISQLVTSPEVI